MYMYIFILCLLNSVDLYYKLSVFLINLVCKFGNVTLLTVLKESVKPVLHICVLLLRPRTVITIFIHLISSYNDFFEEQNFE